MPPLPDADFPLLILVDSPGSTDIIRFADHTDSPTEGNWITLSGGTDVDLPTITMKYSGVTQATYTRGSNQVKLSTYNLNGRTVQYPFSTHQVYTPSQTIKKYTFRGASAHAGKTVSVRVIPVTATDLRDAASDAFKGDTSAMKSILASWRYIYSETLDPNGDLVSKTIGALPAGDYVLVIVDETAGNPYYLKVYSATAIEVLDYESTMTVPSSVTRGNDLSVQVQLTGAGAASRMYGAVIVQQSKYSADLELTSDGTTEGTELTCRGAALIEGTADSFTLAGIGLEGIDKDELINKLNEAYDSSEFSAAFSDYTIKTQQTVKITTSGLNSGDYVVLVGVWEEGSNKLVALTQTDVEVKPTSASFPPSPPTPATIETMTDLGAANTIAEMTPTQGAEIMAQLSTQKAARVMALLQTSIAADIVEHMQAGAAAAIMNLVPKRVATQILAEMQAAQAVAVMEEMDTVKVAEILDEAIKLGKTAVFASYMNQMSELKAADILLEMAPDSGAKIVEAMAEDDLQEAARRVEAVVKKKFGETDPAKAQEIIDKIAKTLENADTETLVDIFVEIANLPETPSTVATVLEAMDTVKVLDVVSTWIGTGSLDELAEVFSYFSDGFLSEVWGGMSAAERSALFTHLASETVQRLPEVGEFQLSALRASPATVAPGQGVTISVAVENVGQDPGVYTIVLKIDGATEQTRKVVMSPGEQQTVQWTVTRTEAKTYSVGVNELAGSFTVQTAPTPAAFTLSNLAVSPSTVEPGASVTIAVAVQNTGGEMGSTLVELKINGVTENTETVTLNAGASDTVTFTVSRSAEGTYAVSIGSLTGGFTVAAPEAPPPSVPWAAILGAVVIVTGIGYYIYSKRRTLKSP